MWGGSKVPPSRPLRTSTRIGTTRVPIDTGPTEMGPPGPGGGAPWRRQQIEAARITGRANQVRERVGVLAVDPNREVQHRPGMSPSRLPNDGSSVDPCAYVDKDNGQERNRGTQSTAMVDRHRQHPGNAPCKGYDPVPDGPDRAAISRSQIEAPMS